MLPSFEWNVDPVAIKFPPFPLQPVALGVAALGGLSALSAWRKSKREDVEDRGGVGFGIMLAIGGVLAAFLWPEARPTLELRYYSLLFVVVFLAGYALLNWQIRRGGGGIEEAGDFIVYGVIGVLVGARLGHVLFYDLEKAIDDPIWVVKIWTGGLSSHGATAGLIIAMYAFTKARSIPFLEGSDRFSFSAATGAALVRLGNFFNSEIVGKKTDGSWGVRFPRFDCPNPKVNPECIAPLRHPTQLYEGTLALFTLLVLFLADRALGKEKRSRGAMIATFFAVYFTGRLGIEFTKEYQVPALEGTFTMGQYLSIIPALLGWYGLWWSLKRKLPVGWVPVDSGESQHELADEDDADSGKRRLYDPDVEEVFGHKRQRGSSPRARRRKATSRAMPARQDDNPQADGLSPEDDYSEKGGLRPRDEGVAGEPKTEDAIHAASEAQEGPAKRRKKRRPV